MTWRLAGSLEKLREQVDEEWPKRSKISDGTIGDAAHASRTSDHNPWCGPGVVTAIDITDDSFDTGPDMAEVTEALRESRDRRIKYVIFNGRMFSSYPTSTYDAWEWRPYDGINKHAAHGHISVNCDVWKDDRGEWSIKRKEWDEVVTKAELKEVVREVVAAELDKTRRELAVGKTAAKKGYDSDKVNIKAAINRKGS